jgi:uncharacterized membrane protein YjgN (DUF898 family)
VSEREIGSAAPPAPPAVTTATLSYHGTGGSLFGLVLLNGLLSIVTLGIYSFWAKTKVRAFHYSHTELDGDRFAYHGTGGELWIGYLKAVGIIFLIFISVGIVSAVVGSGAVGPDPVISLVMSFLAYGIIAALIPVAVNGARRYRLSRSSWRGIRFSYHGKAQDFLAMNVAGFFMAVVTLGFFLPTWQNKRREFFVTNARFGSEPFMYSGTGKELFGEYVKALLLTIPTLGLSWVWYSAFKHRYFWSNTTMRGARFRSTMTGGDLLTLSLTNIVLTLFTLGIGIPWVQTRSHAFIASRISLKGTVEWAAIEQRAQQAGTSGEGLADAFDVDVGIG